MQYIHEVDFLPADKYKSFLQDNSITLVVRSLTCPMCHKQLVYNIFAISQRKHEERCYCCWWIMKISSKWYYGFRFAWPGMPKLPKIRSPIFLCNIKNEMRVMQLVFYLLISMKSCYNLKLRFFDGYGQTFPKFPK